MQLHDQFEWDAAKAKINLKKHGVSFDTAAFVLSDVDADLYHHEQHDDHHDHEEDRYLTVASHPQARSMVLVIVWTERTDHDLLVTRIISARHALPQEKKYYARYILQKIRS